MATTQQLVTGVDLVPLSTQDLEKSKEFYGNKLGLPRSVYVAERDYAEFETGNVTLTIANGEKMGIGHICGSCSTLAWSPRPSARPGPTTAPFRSASPLWPPSSPRRNPDRRQASENAP